MKFSALALFGLFIFAPSSAPSQEVPYNGVSSDLSNLYRLSNAKSLSISPENLTGEKGKAAWRRREPAQVLLATWARDGR